MQKDRKEAKKKLFKFKCRAITFLVFALVFIVTSAFIPMIFNNLMVNNAKKTSQLTAENESRWKGVAGTNDVGIYWDQYFYNCTNAQDVIYKNEKPQFREFGPYRYR